eukprot:TRINITY_DN7148_c0_g1_i5.p1 TRINITY_DN7148_c0_g1~~TRINITY_DN7148_c0_g1_i5.p1  ORF type:complete len:352 (-),score=3.05 TRINITY_DN7148_c0_g1_i5:187-1242(-)
MAQSDFWVNCSECKQGDEKCEHPSLTVNRRALIRQGKLRFECTNCSFEGVLLEEAEIEVLRFTQEVQPLRGECARCRERNIPLPHMIRPIFLCGEVRCRASAQPLLSVCRGNNLACCCCGDTPDTFYVRFSNCAHVIDVGECFANFVRSRLENRELCWSPHNQVSLICPMLCPSSILCDVSTLKLAERENYDRYQAIAAEMEVALNRGMFCPRCHGGIEGPLPEGRTLTCPSHTCRYTFCRDCHGELRDNQCRCQEQQAALEQIERTSKACPFCGTRITHWKGASCHHIRPATGCVGRNPDGTACGRHWCYYCLGEWVSSAHHAGHVFCSQLDCGCPQCPVCQNNQCGCSG